MAYVFHDPRIGEMAAVAALLGAEMVAGAPTVTSFTPAGGPNKGGTVITITGTNFQNGNLTGGTINGTAFVNADVGLVIVDGTHATLVMPSSKNTTLVGTVTPGTAVAIELTNATGTSSNGVTYQYFDLAFTRPDGQAPAPSPAGNYKQVAGYLTLGPSYFTGGITVKPGLLGLTQVDYVLVGCSFIGRPCAWVPAATAGAGGKIKVFAASDTEVANLVDLSLDSVFVVAYGK